MSNAKVSSANRLIHETSPYLKQHAQNPVDWYPWGQQAFQKAREQDKPIFLSIGYSTCHWCHVMAHDSFENPAIAEILNKHFISIKVDREERPDVDAIYMEAVQAMTGSGGWPLSVFLTPEGKPFYGGTYFPPTDSLGRPGFDRLLETIARAWQDSRAELIASAGKLTEILSKDHLGETGDVSPAILRQAYQQLQKSFDTTHGGFGPAPKFPQPGNLSLLLRLWTRNQDPNMLSMVEKTLDAMMAGGIYDHLGGGFHRYSVDEKWLVPHFEKMLYDQGQLMRVYTEAWQVTGKDSYRNIVEQIFHYLQRDMTHPSGGFYSAEDADSEGREGTFYVWKMDEMETLLDGDEISAFKNYYGVTKNGNFEHGMNILNQICSLNELAARLETDEQNADQLLQNARKKLFAIRNQRPRPHRDEKIIVAWNAMAIRSLAYAGFVFNEAGYTAAAERAADFLLSNLVVDGRLMRYWAEDKAHEKAVLDDYAFLTYALIELYEATGDGKYLDESKYLSKEMIRLFAEDKGRFYMTGSDCEQLIVRNIPAYDGALPGGNSVAACALLPLGHLLDDVELYKAGYHVLKGFSSRLHHAPTSLTTMLSALDFHLGPRQEIVIAGSMQSSDTMALLNQLRPVFLPRAARILCDTETMNKQWENRMPHLKPLALSTESPRVYICSNFACQKPATTVQEFNDTIESIRFSSLEGF